MTHNYYTENYGLENMNPTNSLLTHGQEKFEDTKRRLSKVYTAGKCKKEEKKQIKDKGSQLPYRKLQIEKHEPN